MGVSEKGPGICCRKVYGVPCPTQDVGVRVSFFKGGLAGFHASWGEARYKDVGIFLSEKHGS